MVNAMCQEIANRASDLDKAEIETIYFGGGTPSILSIAQLKELFKAVANNFNLNSVVEITLECNPDDISEDYLSAVKQLGVTRISLGVQSVFQSHLKFMARNHNTDDVWRSLKLLSNWYSGSFTIDLIYGVPGMSNENWKACLETVLTYNIQHFSAYALTVEEKTQLSHLVKLGKVNPADDVAYWEQFEMLQVFCQENRYEAYEISNYAKLENRAVHNSNYWTGKPYLGIGPSAHSFLNGVRSWNVSNNMKYIKGLESGQRILEEEILTEQELFNEYIMTRLRMIEGVSFIDVLNKFGWDFLHFLKDGFRSLPAKEDWTKETDSGFSLTTKGKFASDYVIRELIMA